MVTQWTQQLPESGTHLTWTLPSVNAVHFVLAQHRNFLGLYGTSTAANIKNEWSYTSIPTHFLWHASEDQDNFTFTFTLYPFINIPLSVLSPINFSCCVVFAHDCEWSASCPCRNNLYCSLNTRIGGPQRLCGCGEKGKYLLPLLRMAPQSSSEHNVCVWNSLSLLRDENSFCVFKNLSVKNICT